MGAGEMLAGARRAAGLSQDELAHRAATSRPTVSAYEHGRKSPTLATAIRLLAATGHTLEATVRVEFTEHALPRGRSASVPNELPRLTVAQVVRTVVPPLHLDWSKPARSYRLSDRADRARVYEIVLREGHAADITAYIDGAFLVDLWDELVLPRAIRAAREPVIEATRSTDRS